jgi:hypothetical protein
MAIAVGIPEVRLGQHLQFQAGWVDIPYQLSTDVYVVIAGLEFTVVEWDEIVLRFFAAGNALTVQVYGSDKSDWSDETALGAALAVGSSGWDKLILSRWFATGTTFPFYRTIRAKVKATVGGAQGLIYPYITARRVTI